MAQAQYDKFIELRKSWVDALTARKQAYWDIPTAPTVTPPPTTTAPVTPQSTMQGANWETFQVAPVNAQGVTPQAPQSVAPVQPVTPNTPPPTQNVTPTAIPTEIKPTTPETKKVEPTIDFNLSQGREWDIQKNVADITAWNPTLLKDRNAYNQAFGYETADQWKKALLDSAFQSGQPQVPNADMMFSSILMKAPVPDDQKTTTQYKIAQNRYLKANSYASMTPSQLSSDITSGKLIEWSQTYEDIKSMKPKLVQDTNNLRIVNGSKVSLYSNDAQGNKVNNVEQSFTEDYLWDFWTFLKDLFKVKTVDEINAVIRTDEVKDAEAKADEYERELNAIEEWGLEIEKRVRKELEWTGASAERIRLEVAIAQEENDKKYNSVLKKYTQYANKANNLMTQNTTVYQESQKQLQAQQQALAGAAWQVFSSELAKEKSLYDAQLWLDTKQAEFEQWLAQQAEMAKDPTTAIWGILSQFQKLGITSDMDVAGHLASFQASWLSLPEYTKQMIENFKAKPEYQKAMQLQMGQLSDAQKMSMWYAQDISKMKMEQDFQMSLAKAKQTTDKKWTKLDDGLYTNENGDIITWDELKAAKLMWNSYITKQVWEEWGDCGFYASRGTWMTATPWGNSKDARVQAFSDATPQVGGMALFTWSWYDQTYGHISIVTGVNQDGTINVKESNYGNDKKVTERTVPASSVTGYYNNTPLAKWAGTQWTFTATEEAWANNIMNKTAKISDITNKDNVDKWRVLQLINEKSGGSTWAMQTNLQSGLEIVNSLINHPWFTDVVWVPSIFVNPLGYSLPWTSARDFKAELQRMEAIGFLNMIPQMQGMGALSNAEGSRLAAAYSKLSNTGISEKEYKEELKRLKDGMESALSKMWVQVPETPKTEVKQTVGGEKSYSKYE